MVKYRRALEIEEIIDEEDNLMEITTSTEDTIKWLISKDLLSTFICCG